MTDSEIAASQTLQDAMGWIDYHTRKGLEYAQKALDAAHESGRRDLTNRLVEVLTAYRAADQWLPR